MELELDMDFYLCKFTSLLMRARYKYCDKYRGVSSNLYHQACLNDFIEPQHTLIWSLTCMSMTHKRGRIN